MSLLVESSETLGVLTEENELRADAAQDFLLAVGVNWHRVSGEAS
jgi:hypothetical protein